MPGVLSELKIVQPRSKESKFCIVRKLWIVYSRVLISDRLLADILAPFEENMKAVDVVMW